MGIGGRSWVLTGWCLSQSRIFNRYHYHYYYFYIIVLLVLSISGCRGRVPREKLLLLCGGILIRLPSSIASGFGGQFTFSLLVEMAISKLRAGPALA